MYRTPLGPPPTPSSDPNVIVPGWGIGAAVVGRSTAREILEAFGGDAKVSRYDGPAGAGEGEGEIFSISYDYENQEDYNPGRPAQRTRPSEFAFEFGLLHSIEAGAYQTKLVTAEGVRLGMPRQEVLAALPSPIVIRGDDFDTLRWLDRGLQVDVDHDDDQVMGMVVFRARW